MRLEESHRPEQPGVALREPGGHGVEWLGGAHPGDHVLTLGVDQEIPIGTVLPGRRVPREGDTGAGVGPCVAEHHHLDADGRAEVIGNAFEAPVVARPSSVPRLEHGDDRNLELLEGIGRERPLPLPGDDRLELGDESTEFVPIESLFVRHPRRSDSRCERGLERVARHAECDATEHLQESSSGIEGEPLVTGPRRKAGDGIGSETQIEDRVHHPRHRERRTGPDGEQQRISGIAEPATGTPFEHRDRPAHLVEQIRRQTTVGHVRPTRLGRHDEPGRHGEAESRHLGEIGTLAAEECRLFAPSFGERPDPLHRAPPPPARQSDRPCCTLMA